ncbi:MAG: 50S ribosomal protein L11 methyltransferase [Holophagaceae bacterium]|nr:50S ribosomal protein L11 methyltransferase [Holophagaceae bacterium]
MRPTGAPDDSQALAKDTRLRLAEAVRLDVRGPWIRLETGGVALELPRSILPALAFFEDVHSLEEGWRFLASGALGAQGLAEAVGRIMALAEAGILVPEHGLPARRRDSAWGAFGPAAQIRMLEDRPRTTRYLRAIRQTVRPGDVVVDVGTGTGVLALAAAKAGAARVYAIESQPIADAALQLFQGSGFGGRIVLMRGRSTELALPELADVMVSELFGHDPFGERILETTGDAASRFLKPGARLIPARLRIFATPVEVPEPRRQDLFFTPENLERWERWYGLPLAALRGSEAGFQRAYVNPWEARAWPVLAEPMLLHDLPLADAPPSPSCEVDLRFARSGNLGGLLVHFEADLAEGISLSTAAAQVTRRNHWKTPLWLFREPRRVRRGGRLALRSEVRNGTMELGVDESLYRR